MENPWTVDGLPLVEALHFTVGRDEQICLPKNIPITDIASTLSYDISEEEKASGKIAKILYQYDGRTVGTAYVYLEDSKREEDNKDLPNTSLKKAENIPKQISVAMENQENESKAEESTAMEKINHAPIVFDKKAGKIILQKPILRVLQILFAIFTLVLLSLLFLYFFQRREEFYRARRRKRMLKHTKDLSREQKAKRDLMFEKRKRQKK